MPVCKKCGETKEITEFPLKDKEACRVCKRREIVSRCRVKHKEKRVLYDCENYHTVHGRALTLLTAMRRRSKKEGWVVPEFSLGDVKEALSIGVCAATGLPFVLRNNTNSLHNPYAPSPDRIDSGIGYTKGNVQWVIWAVNRMKAQFSQEVFDKVIDSFISKRRTNT